MEMHAVRDMPNHALDYSATEIIIIAHAGFLVTGTKVDGRPLFQCWSALQRSADDFLVYFASYITCCVLADRLVIIRPRQTGYSRVII